MLRSAVERQVLGAPNPSVGCRSAPGAEPQQRLKSRRRFSPAVVPKRELVQVDLELRPTDAVMSPDEPLLKIADRAVSQGHDRLGALAQSLAQRLRARDMPKAGGLQASKLLQPIGAYSGPS